MCRTVSDAVHVLDTIVGYDEHDAAATGAASKYHPAGVCKALAISFVNITSLI